jgi:hypothetical protein
VLTVLSHYSPEVCVTVETKRPDGPKSLSQLSKIFLTIPYSKCTAVLFSEVLVLKKDLHDNFDIYVFMFFFSHVGSTLLMAPPTAHSAQNPSSQSPQTKDSR